MECNHDWVDPAGVKDSTIDKVCRVCGKKAISPSIIEKVEKELIKQINEVYRTLK